MPDRSDGAAEVRESIRNISRDPVAKLLLQNSQLTLSQFETLLADSLSRENETRKSRRYLYRPSRARITRGSYNRTLFQAQNNVIRSIYTILLLGYVGLFDSAALQPFIELADTITSYVQESRKPSDRSDTVVSIAIDQLNIRLLETIAALAKHQSFNDVL